MTRKLAWPAELERQEDGSVVVSFPGIPEALTGGATHAEAPAQAQDCLIAAPGGYVGARRSIPRPSRACGRATVAPPALVAAKIAPYGAMRAQGIGNTALAVRLGLSGGAVRRLIDLDHRSHIGQIETALRALGQRLTVGARAAWTRLGRHREGADAGLLEMGATGSSNVQDIMRSAYLDHNGSEPLDPRASASRECGPGGVRPLPQRDDRAGEPVGAGREAPRGASLKLAGKHGLGAVA